MRDVVTIRLTPLGIVVAVALLTGLLILALR